MFILLDNTLRLNNSNYNFAQKLTDRNRVDKKVATRRLHFNKEAGYFSLYQLQLPNKFQSQAHTESIIIMILETMNKWVMLTATFLQS